MPRALEALEHTLQGLEHGEISVLDAHESLLAEEFTTRETPRCVLEFTTPAEPLLPRLEAIAMLIF